MAKKFSISQAPTFVGQVPIPRIGGPAVDVPFTFRYMDREALAALYQGWGEKHRDLAKRSDDLKLPEYTTAQIDIQVEQIKAVVESWGFDEPFDDLHIRALVASARSVPEAVLDAYSKAFEAARLGN